MHYKIVGLPRVKCHGLLLCIGDSLVYSHGGYVHLPETPKPLIIIYLIVCGLFVYYSQLSELRTLWYTGLCPLFESVLYSGVRVISSPIHVVITVIMLFDINNI